MQPPDPDWQPMGYQYLIEAWGLLVPKPWHASYVAARGGRQQITVGGLTRTVFPPSYARPLEWADQIAFALKYDGVELEALAALFAKLDGGVIEDWVRSKPTGKYARRAWFLFEWLTGQRLNLPDLSRGGYIDLLDPEQYFTAPRRQSARYRINDNLLGTVSFCPTVRRTPLLVDMEEAALDERCRAIAQDTPPALLRRAVDYLFLKETRSSFAMERETPSALRAERFVAALMRAGSEDFLDQVKLIALQNQVVDSRFCDSSYRSDQNYVSQTVGWTDQRVHYVCPQPQDVSPLMDGLIAAQGRMTGSLLIEVHPVVHAAVVGFGFVFIHPFSDGNGRLHRFLIHQVLAQRGFTPSGMILPVSAVMLDQMADYDAALEAFSRPRLTLIDYELDAAGEMTVAGDTGYLYRYPDLTPQAEALAGFVTHAVNEGLPRELAFLRGYDECRAVVRREVDLPDRLLDLLLRLLGQHDGKLSARKRAAHFSMLTDDEIRRVEGVFGEVFGLD